MTHDHTHDHSHSHEHDHSHSHEHDHGHQHEIQSDMSFEEKMVKLLDHWIRHNDDHAGTYRGWAEKARDHHMESTSDLLMEAAQMTLAINGKFEAALAALMPSKPS